MRFARILVGYRDDLDLSAKWWHRIAAVASVQVMMRRVARRANVKPRLHILRHTFCSHLAKRRARARAIQELSGHQDLGTTQR